MKNARTGEFYPSIKVIINQTYYWQRIIDAEDVRKNGAKTKIVGDYKDLGWIPPGMTFDSDDEVWITEGIFKSISFLHAGKKSMESLSASNLPRRVIADYAGKNITWVIALDNDKIGNENTKKYMEEIRKLGERVKAAFPEAGGKDWDDIFREGKLNDFYLSDSVWRGFYLLSDTPSRRAFFHYCRTQK